MTTIAVVTPWHNHEELAADYFAAVEPELEPGDQLLVVDNASDIRLAFAQVRSATNLGFSGGSNLGLRHASTDAVLFLNNDIALGQPGWLERVRAAVEPGVLVGPLRHDGHASVDGRSLPYLDGWCLAGMRTDLVALGGFDETLAEPAYYSDNLICLEARAAGMRLRDVRPGIVHKLNATAGPAQTPRVRDATARNRAVYEARARALLVAA